MAAHLQGKRVLEVFSGNGLLAALLQQQGVAVKATTRFSSHDAHEHGLFTEVQALDATAAVQTWGELSDVLLICWPPATESVLAAAHAWGSEKPILYIGEVTDYAKGHLAGCASDGFFEAIEETHRLQSYRGNLLERAFECRLRAAR